MFTKPASVILMMLALFIYGCQSNGHDGSRDGSYDGSAPTGDHVPTDVPRGDTAEWNREYQWEGPWGAPQKWNRTSEDFETAQMASYTINVELSDYAIEMPARLTPGPIKFVVANAGAAPHRLIVEGNGMRYDLGRTLQPGESGVMQFHLAPGAYEVYCPIGDHARMGMQRLLEVALP